MITKPLWIMMSQTAFENSILIFCYFILQKNLLNRRRFLKEYGFDDDENYLNPDAKPGAFYTLLHTYFLTALLCPGLDVTEMKWSPSW